MDIEEKVNESISSTVKYSETVSIADAIDIDKLPDTVIHFYHQYLRGELPKTTKEQAHKELKNWFENGTAYECTPTTDAIDARFEKCDANKRKRVDGVF